MPMTRPMPAPLAEKKPSIRSTSISAVPASGTACWIMLANSGTKVSPTPLSFMIDTSATRLGNRAKTA